MDPLRRKLLLTTAAAAALPAPLLRAQDARWPNRPVHLVVTGTAGGVVDLRTRWLAERLAPALGQPIVVDNKPGAGGNVGMAEVARSAADGYTVAMVHQGTMAINPHLYARAGYDPLADFAPVTRMGMGPLLMASHPDLPVRSVAELIQLAKAKPGQLKFGSPGIGTPPHLAGELFLHMAGITATHVPYKGGGEALRDLLAGHLNFSIEGFTVQLPQVKAGRLRALATTGAQRSPAVPELPTIAEAGVPGYEYIGWSGLAVPAATPKAIVQRLYDEIAKIYATAEARAWFASLAAEPGGHTPEEFAAFIRAEHAKWGRVIRDAGIRLE